MLDIKKIRKRRKDLLKKFDLNHPNRVDQFSMLSAEQDNPIENEHRHHAWAESIQQFGDEWRIDYMIYAASTGRPEIFRAAIGLMNSAFLYGTYMYRELAKLDQTRTETRGPFFGTDLNYLIASGYETLAQVEADFTFSTQDIADQLHANYNRVPHGFDRFRHDWFPIFLAMSDPSVAAARGYQPTPEEFGPFWILLDKWDAEDPTEVRNALTATHEFMVANATLPESKRHYLVGIDVLLWDFEIRAINEKRRARGLATVEVETYLDEDLVGDAPIPFVRDDIFWPSHLRYCEELDIAPYEFKGDVIDVSLDPQNGEIRT